MTWLSMKSKIPSGDDDFDFIIHSLLFNCPSCTRKKEPKSSNNNAKQNTIYTPVSTRNNSFRERKITGNYLRTVSAQLKKEFRDKKCFVVIKSDDSVIDTMTRIENSSSMTDGLFEVIVAKDRSDMSEAEAIYYYIRNSFAHGSFEVVEMSNERIYILESANKGDVKARMRLKESTLKKYCQIAKMKRSDLEKLNRKNVKKNKKS